MQRVVRESNERRQTPRRGQNVFVIGRNKRDKSSSSRSHYNLEKIIKSYFYHGINNRRNIFDDYSSRSLEEKSTLVNGTKDLKGRPYET